VEVHGITGEFLQDKPRFADVEAEFTDFIRGAELVIHNAPFDVGFIDHEFHLLDQGKDFVKQHCRVLDTLMLARRLHPGQRNSLDALCRRYEIDNSQRELHGALLDAEILADVYLAMTGGQVSLSLDASAGGQGDAAGSAIRPLAGDRPALKVIRASQTELEAHEARLDAIDRQGEKLSVWRR
jgi:DNA polymerase-3 subunit epsilon